MAVRVAAVMAAAAMAVALKDVGWPCEYNAHENHTGAGEEDTGELYCERDAQRLPRFARRGRSSRGGGALSSSKVAAP